MLAQKKPIIALIINIHDSWGSLYFQNLNDFKIQLIEYYLLVFDED